MPHYILLARLSRLTTESNKLHHTCGDEEAGLLTWVSSVTQGVNGKRGIRCHGCEPDLGMGGFFIQLHELYCLYRGVLVLLV